MTRRSLIIVALAALAFLTALALTDRVPSCPVDDARCSGTEYVP